MGERSGEAWLAGALTSHLAFTPAGLCSSGPMRRTKARRPAWSSGHKKCGVIPGRPLRSVSSDRPRQTGHLVCGAPGMWRAVRPSAGDSCCKKLCTVCLVICVFSVQFMPVPWGILIIILNSLLHVPSAV